MECPCIFKFFFSFLVLGVFMFYYFNLVVLLLLLSWTRVIFFFFFFSMNYFFSSGEFFGEFHSKQLFRDQYNIGTSKRRKQNIWNKCQESLAKIVVHTKNSLQSNCLDNNIILGPPREENKIFEMNVENHSL